MKLENSYKNNACNRKPFGIQLSTMVRRPSKAVQFRANWQDQKRLTLLRKKYDMNNAEVIREALRCLAEKAGK
jgi:hypothetical protein